MNDDREATARDVTGPADGPAAPISDADLARMEADARQLAGLRSAADAPLWVAAVEEWTDIDGHSRKVGTIRGGPDDDLLFEQNYPGWPRRLAARVFVADAARLDTSADVLALAAEVRRLREALSRIRDECGQVCGVDFMTCDHPACASSYGAWAIAVVAIGPTSRGRGVTERDAIEPV